MLLSVTVADSCSRSAAGARRQQLRLRATRTLLAAVRPRRPQHRLSRPMGDRGLQAAPPLAQRRTLQAHLRHLDRLQEHRVEDRQRAETVTTGGGGGLQRGRGLRATPRCVGDLCAGEGLTLEARPVSALAIQASSRHTPPPPPSGQPRRRRVLGRWLSRP